jgi:hypothetical protein
MTTKNSPLEVVSNQGAEEKTPADGLSDVIVGDSGLEQAIANASSDWWFRGALVAIRQLALAGRGFTADHLLDMVGAPTDSHHVGALFAAAQKLRIIEAVGARVGRDGRLVRVWWGLPS